MSVYRFRQAPRKINDYWAGTSISSYFATELDIDSPESLSTVQPIIEALGYEYLETDPLTEPSVWRKRTDGYYQRMPLTVATIPSVLNPSADFDAEAGGLYFVDSASTVITVTPPQLPNVGDSFAIGDSSGNFAINNVTVDFPSSSQLFLGVSQVYIFDLSGDYKTFIYSGATYGWILT